MNHALRPLQHNSHIHITIVEKLKPADLDGSVLKLLKALVDPAGLPKKRAMKRSFLRGELRHLIEGVADAVLWKAHLAGWVSETANPTRVTNQFDYRITERGLKELERLESLR